MKSSTTDFTFTEFVQHGSQNNLWRSTGIKCVDLLSQYHEEGDAFSACWWNVDPLLWAWKQTPEHGMEIPKTPC